MPTYQYQALDNEGKKKKGFIEAESQTRALSLLQVQGMMPLRLDPVRSKEHTLKTSFSLKSLVPSRKIRISESFYYLGMLLQSGTSLAQALDMLGRMTSGKGGKIWLDIRDSVKSGEKFSDCLAKYPKTFPGVYVGMIRVAESVGKLGAVLEQVARYEEERAEVSGRLLTAMVYPAVICLAGFGAVYFLLTVVLPKISTVFDASGRELPWNTRVLLSLGDVFSSMGIAALLLPLALILALFHAYRRYDSFRLRVDRLLWKIPLAQRSILARFSGMLGFQLNAGIPLVQALDSASGAVPSLFFRRHIEEAGVEVSTGVALDKVLAKQGIFPELYVITVSTGQKAGQLGDFLLRLARVLEREVDSTQKRLVALAEPLLILLVGVMVAFIVVAIMGPIFDLSTLVR